MCEISISTASFRYLRAKTCRQMVVEVKPKIYQNCQLMKHVELLVVYFMLACEF